MKKKGIFASGIWTGLIVVAVFIGLLADMSFAKTESDDSADDSFYAGLHLLERTLQKIHSGYVTPIDNKELIRSAIDGAISTLDPHTTFYEPEDFEELQVQTNGEFGGLGIQISIRDEILTIMTPLAGTPAERAGLRSGDKIIKIDTTETKDISLNDAVDLMRGTPGTEVTLFIAREGEPELIEYVIERAIIEIKSVPFAGILQDSIGYVRLNSFSKDAGEKVREKTDSLLALGMNSMIFDLRYNPGGLLDQARDVANVFLPEKKLVVFTKGRLESDIEELYTEQSSVIPDTMPLIVMVNGASASAAEIVSGAVQDWDRGVILGDTTFGKGSVQRIMPIDRRRERYMKMTTSFYYTPSGRCINRPENGVKSKNKKRVDSVQADSAKSEVYYTEAGRPVYGGGGIIPDTLIQRDYEGYILQKFLLKDIFFKYANHIYPDLEHAGVTVDETYEITDSMVQAFFAFADTVGFDYKTAAGERLKEFKVYNGLAVDTTIDSTTMSLMQTTWSGEDSSKVVSLVKELESLLKKKRVEQLNENSEQIKWYMLDALLVRQTGRDNPIVHRRKLKKDNQLQSAIELLNNRELYTSILKKRVSKSKKK